MTGDDDAKIRKHVIENFIKRNRTRMRAKQRNRKLPKEECRQKMADWHLNTRERLVHTGKAQSYDTK